MVMSGRAASGLGVMTRMTAVEPESFYFEILTVFFFFLLK